MAVGFADMANYSKLVTSVGDEKAVEYLQEAFKAAGDIIIKNGGHIHKYIGDGILFSFADPKMAVLAAKEIASSYSQEIGDLTLKYNVSVATGDVLICKVGHPSYLVNDIMGEVVDRAAMLIKKAYQSSSGVAFCDKTKSYE